VALGDHGRVIKELDQLVQQLQVVLEDASRMKELLEHKDMYGPSYGELVSTKVGLEENIREEGLVENINVFQIDCKILHSLLQTHGLRCSGYRSHKITINSKNSIFRNMFSKNNPKTLI
jgi:hypothetical protein